MNNNIYCNKLKAIHSLLLNNSYTIGSFLSLILTIIPFVTILHSNFSSNYIKKIIILCAILQIIVHLTCFFHIKNKTNESFFWNVFVLLFAVMIILIIFIGSMFIMFNLHYNYDKFI